MTLTEFLLARIAEDEALARAAYDHDSWSVVEDGNGDPWVVQTDVTGQEWRVAMVPRVPAEHIAQWDPARVLAECEAKRQIVALHSAEPGQHPDFCGHDLRELPCPTLRALALPYIDSTDYQPEWKP